MLCPLVKATPEVVKEKKIFDHQCAVTRQRDVGRVLKASILRVNRPDNHYDNLPSDNLPLGCPAVGDDLSVQVSRFSCSRHKRCTVGQKGR